MANHESQKHERRSDMFTKDGSDESRREYGLGKENNNLPSPLSPDHGTQTDMEQVMEQVRAYYTEEAQNLAERHQGIIDQSIIDEYESELEYAERQQAIAQTLLDGIEERQRDFAGLLYQMQQDGLSTEDAEAIIDRAWNASDRTDVRTDSAKSRPGAQFMCFIFLLLVCCVWMGLVMAIRDDKLTWQAIWELEVLKGLRAWMRSEVWSCLHQAAMYLVEMFTGWVRNMVIRV